MRTNRRRFTHVTIAMGALALAILAATPGFGAGNQALRIRAVTVHGNRIAITVANVSARPRTGAVTSRVLTPSGPVAVRAQVSAAPGQSVTVEVQLPIKVQDDLPVGVVVDDGVPF